MYKSTMGNEIKPRELTQVQKCKIYGRINDSEMIIMAQIITKSAAGLWTKRNDIVDGVRVTKYLYELMHRKLGLNIRLVDDFDAAGRSCCVHEYCV